jgi:fructokinase
MFLLGLDVGGTKIECALLKLGERSGSGFAVSTAAGKEYHAEIIARERIPTDRHLGYDTVLNNTTALIGSVCEKSGVTLSKIQGLGVGMPGSVDPVDHIMLNGNTAIFIGRDFSSDLKKKLGADFRTAIENDANLFALAEVDCGAGQVFKKETGLDIKEHIAIGIIIGTGCGGGIVIKGKILQGKDGGGGELGHTELVTDGHPCYCGRKGCAEQYLSGPGLEALFSSRKYSQISHVKNARDIFELAIADDPIAKAVIQEHKRYLVKFLTNLTNIFNPHYFVLGGGVSLNKSLYENITEMINEHAFLKKASPRVYQHQLGDSSGVIGAALQVL